MATHCKKGHGYAIQMEDLFRRYKPSDYPSADEFENSPEDVLERELNYCVAAKIIKLNTAAMLKEICDFGSESLSEYLSKENNVKCLERLINEFEKVLSEFSENQVRNVEVEER